jgi:hypothetical protein
VLGRHDGVSRRDEGLGELTVLKILLCPQDREIEVRHFDPRHLVAGDRSTFRMGIGRVRGRGASRLDPGWPWIIATRRSIAPCSSSLEFFWSLKDVPSRHGELGPGSIRRWTSAARVVDDPTISEAAFPVQP